MTTLGKPRFRYLKRGEEKNLDQEQLLLYFSCSLGILDTPRPGDQTKRGRHKGRNKQEAPISVEACQPVEKAKTPLDLAKVGVFGNYCY